MTHPFCVEGHAEKSSLNLNDDSESIRFDSKSHARDARDGQRQPAVLEAARHDVTQEDRSGVLVVGRVVVTTARHVPTRPDRRPLGLQSLLLLLLA